MQSPGKVWKIHRKKPALESFLNKIAGYGHAKLIKRDSKTGGFLQILKIFKNTYRPPLADCFWDLVKARTKILHYCFNIKCFYNLF